MSATTMPQARRPARAPRSAAVEASAATAMEAVWRRWRTAGRTTVRCVAFGVLAGAAAAAEPTSCRVESPRFAVPVVELYTSEGCNSCPPADRWASAWRGDAHAVVLAFHVDYWDRLGWTDRFARPAYTERQRQESTRNGARFSYTPQVVIDGADRKDWPAVPTASPRPQSGAPAAPVTIVLVRTGAQVEARIDAGPHAPPRLAGYWAAVEHGHVSDVRSGENRGVVLHHDHVVRDLQPVAAWPAEAGGARKLTYAAPAAGSDPRHPREVVFVVVDARSGKPVQAAKIAC